jgi:hypothetical protein
MKENVNKLVEYLLTTEKDGLYDLDDRLIFWINTELARDADPRRGLLHALPLQPSVP